MFTINKNWGLGFLSAFVLCLISCGIQPTPKNYSLRLIDKSMKHANEIMDWESRCRIERMREENQLRSLLSPLAEVAASVPSEIKSLLDKINALRVRITEESGGLYSLREHGAKWKGDGYKKIIITTDSTKDGTAVGFGNKSVVQRVLIGEKEGEALKIEIIKTREALIAVLEKFNAKMEKEQVPGVKLDQKAIEALKKELVLELPQNPNDKSFTELAFGNLSVEEANLMLRKFESDARVACSQIINYLDSNMSRGAAIVYDKIDVLYMPTKYAIYLGETYEAKIALGQMSSQLEFSVNINENNLPMDGMTAIYRVEPKLIGTHRYSATINVKNPRTGEMERIRKDFQYEVLEPRKK